LGRFFAEHQGVEPVGEITEVPGGKAATFLDPAGNAVRVFDQSSPEPE